MKHEDAKEIPFSKDYPMVILVLINSLLMLIGTLSVVLRLRPNDFKVPVQYIVHDGTIVQSGNWFSLYSLVFFILGGGIITVILASKLHKANRLFAVATLAIYTFVAVFSILAINALLGLVEKV